MRVCSTYLGLSSRLSRRGAVVVFGEWISLSRIFLAEPGVVGVEMLDFCQGWVVGITGPSGGEAREIDFGENGVRRL